MGADDRRVLPASSPVNKAHPALSEELTAVPGALRLPGLLLFDAGFVRRKHAHGRRIVAVAVHQPAKSPVRTRAKRAHAFDQFPPPHAVVVGVAFRPRLSPEVIAGVAIL